VSEKKLNRAVRDICLFMEAVTKKMPGYEDEVSKLYLDVTDLFKSRSKYACLKVLGIVMSELLINLRRKSNELQGSGSKDLQSRGEEGSSEHREREGSTEEPKGSSEGSGVCGLVGKVPREEVNNE
jgi:hypothetical protein